MGVWSVVTVTSQSTDWRWRCSVVCDESPAKDFTMSRVEARNVVYIQYVTPSVENYMRSRVLTRQTSSWRAPDHPTHGTTKKIRGPLFIYISLLLLKRQAIISADEIKCHLWEMTTMYVQYACRNRWWGDQRRTFFLDDEKLTRSFAVQPVTNVWHLPHSWSWSCSHLVICIWLIA